MLICLCSAKGSPGVTTSALALALSWPGEVVLADLDPAGGDVLAGYGRGEISAGLEEILVAARRDGLTRRLDAHLLTLDTSGRARLLPGLADPGAARHLDWSRVASSLATVGESVGAALADCGRLRTEYFPAEVVDQADVVVLVTRSSLRDVHAAARGIEELRINLGPRALLLALVVGPGEPYAEREISDALRVPVVASLPRDAKPAAVLSDGRAAGRSFAQTSLMRAARVAASRLAEASWRHASATLAQPSPGVARAVSGSGHGD
jgi:MinD-like ATPase involved in chromosome partitioning or flagellar assembly